MSAYNWRQHTEHVSKFNYLGSIISHTDNFDQIGKNVEIPQGKCLLGRDSQTTRKNEMDF